MDNPTPWNQDRSEAQAAGERLREPPEHHERRAPRRSLQKLRREVRLKETQRQEGIAGRMIDDEQVDNPDQQW